MLKRAIKERIDRALSRGKSILLLGCRQTGKTTLIREYSADLEITLLISKIRRGYESDPDLLIREVEALRADKGSLPLVVIDEVQKVPPLMDGVQYLIDKGVAQFILTGSSARKLKHGKSVNLLPGRVIRFHLDPLSLDELERPLSSIEDFLLYGSLPAIKLSQEKGFKEEELDSYVDLYLEDEVRSEALVRDIGAFENFLRLAAMESGNVLNFDKISQDVGVARTTIASYYQILEDCLVVHRVEPFIESRSRKKLTKSPKYLFFDLGIRRLAAHEPPTLPESYLGSLFEQFIGLELLRWASKETEKVEVKFWREPSGPEVDWLLVKGQKLLPIEVKWTERPALRDAKHLELFLKEHSSVKKAYVVCRVERPQLLSENVEAISWKDLHRKLATWE